MKIKEKVVEWVRVSTYAKEKGLSVQAIYKQIKLSKVKHIKIDGITFIEKITNTREYES